MRARSLRGTMVIGVALVVAFAGCGGGSDSTTSPQTPGEPSTPSTLRAPTGPTVTVALGSDVAAATVTKVTSYVTLGDSIGAVAGVPGRAFGVAADTGSVPVIALDASGDPLAAAFAPLNSATVLDATSTALVLTRVLIPSGELELPNEAMLRQTIAQRPEFAALVDTVHAAMSRGTSYATSASAVAEASIVAAAVIRTISPAPVAGFGHVGGARLVPLADETIGVTTPVFTHYPITISATGGEIGLMMFANASSASFALKVTPQPGTDDSIPAERFCPLCLPPAVTPVAPKTGYPAPGTTAGDLTATASFGQTQRQAAAAQFVLDIAAGIFRISGWVVSEDSLKSVISAAAPRIDVAAAAAQGAWHDAAATLLNQVVPALPNIGTSLLPKFPRFAGRAGLSALLRVTALPLASFDNSGWASGKLATYSDAAAYWNAQPETVLFCLTHGTLYNACATTVTVTLSSSAVTPGATVQATATATDAAADTLTGLPVTWVVIAGPASVDQNGLVTTTGVGTVTIDATIQKTLGTVNLTVQP